MLVITEARCLLGWSLDPTGYCKILRGGHGACWTEMLASMLACMRVFVCYAGCLCVYVNVLRGDWS